MARRERAGIRRLKENAGGGQSSRLPRTDIHGPGRRFSWPRGATWLGVLFVFPVSILLTVFFFYPLVTVLGRSFTDPRMGVDNYTALWTSTAFRHILGNTFSIALWTTIITLALAYPFAYRLRAASPRVARTLLAISLIPFWTAIIARLYAWTIILGRDGIVNDSLEQLGLTHEPVDLLFNRTAVVIGMVHIMLPYMIIVLYGVMQQIDRAVLDASVSLGAGPWATFRRIYLPLSMPGVYAGSILVFLLSLGYYVTPAVLGGGRDTTIATYIQQQVAILEWGSASAMGAVLLIVTLILFAVFNKVFGASQFVAGGTRG